MRLNFNLSLLQPSGGSLSDISEEEENGESALVGMLISCLYDYPANATILGQSGARKNPIKKTISYAIIKACIIGESNEDGSRSFLRFERKDWGESASFSPGFLLLTHLPRCGCVELWEERFTSV